MLIYNKMAFNPDDVNILTKADEIIDWSVSEGKNPYENEEYMLWMTQQHERWTGYIREQIEEKKIEVMVDKIVDWCVREGKNPYVDMDAEEMMDKDMHKWWKQYRNKYGMKLNIEDAINRAMVDKITDWCVREGKNPYVDMDAEEMMDEDMQKWWKQHHSVRSIKRNIENGIKEKKEKRNSNRKTVATLLSLSPLSDNIKRSVNKDRRKINNNRKNGARQEFGGRGRKSKKTGKNKKNKKNKHTIPVKI